MRPDPINLNDAYKAYCHDQDKVISPIETVQNFKHKLKETGLKILDEVVRVDNGRLGIPVYFSLCGPDARNTIGNVKQMGKGATPEQAQASAVMELAERFSLFHFYQDHRNFQTSPLEDLTDRAIDFEMIAQSVNDTSDDLDVVRPFFMQLPLQWTWAHNLSHDETMLIPFNWFWTINQFNGASAGNGIEEALCQGICEVVERHVSALICRGHLNVPLIDPDSISDPVAKALLDKYNSNGIKTYLSDFTCNMGIPSVGVLAWDPSTFPHSSEMVWTAGTSPQPEKALCRALTEVAQLAGDFNSSSNYEASGLPKFHSIEEARFITHSGLKIGLKSLPDLSNKNIKTEINNCIQALNNRHREVITVDVRHPQLNIPAFYSIIPGMLFRERTSSANVAMMCAKVITESFSGFEAGRWLTRMNALLPDKYFIQFYLAQLSMNQSDPATAEQLFSHAASLNPPKEELADIHTYLGLCRKDMEQYRQALEALLKADEIDSERTDTLNLIGFCHFKLGEHEAAIEAFKRILSINPSSAIDYANLAVNYRAMGKRDKAIENYQLALALDPTIEFARDHLIQMGLKNGSPDGL